MSVKRIIAIIFIYLSTTIAWMILGVSTGIRTDSSFSSIKSMVVNLYGDELVINAPYCSRTRHVFADQFKDYKEPYDFIKMGPEKSDISISTQLDQRKKGNLWFPTFKSKFIGKYEFTIDNFVPQETFYIYASLHSTNSIYNNITLWVNGEQQNDILPLVQSEPIPVVPDENGNIQLEISYDCTGMENIRYFITPKDKDISQINNFNLTMTTDFKNIDFPNNMMSPTSKTETKDGYTLEWNLDSSVTGKDIGLNIPNKLNPGKIVSRVTFFAPVSLLFFFIVIFIFSITFKTRLHPMNYFFLAATFFSFHLMYSYFSDHLNLYLTFAIASVVSLFLTISYLRLFTPAKFALLVAPVTQVLYLIVFSYSFFFKGFTGVIVTICSVITLFILMQITAKIKWEQVFDKNQQQEL